MCSLKKVDAEEKCSVTSVPGIKINVFFRRILQHEEVG